MSGTFCTLTDQLAEIQVSELEGMPACPAQEEGWRSASPLDLTQPLPHLSFKLCPRALSLLPSSPSGLMAVTHLC